MLADYHSHPGASNPRDDVASGYDMQGAYEINIQILTRNNFDFSKLPSFYIEYSGKYGDVDVVKRVSEELNETLLFYGGGIKSLAQAKEMSTYADVIIVGNIIYEDIELALETTKIKQSK